MHTMHYTSKTYILLDKKKHTLKHEIEDIAYRDFESTIDIGIIEAIRHSAIGNNIKKEYRSIDSMKKGA